jgi:hypothetical protein
MGYAPSVSKQYRMKTVLLICAAIMGFVAVSVIYSTVKGYTTWFWRNPHAQVFVNGQRVSGYVHQSKHVVIVTWHGTQRPHSYEIGLRDQSQNLLLDCGEWAAPRFFVFALGHVNPPCLATIGDESAYAAPGAAAGPVQRDGKSFEFRTRDGKLIRVLR